jgi:hypothetical protein
LRDLGEGVEINEAFAKELNGLNSAKGKSTPDDSEKTV